VAAKTRKISNNEIEALGSSAGLAKANWRVMKIKKMKAAYRKQL
jgi:hypothetical protein